MDALKLLTAKNVEALGLIVGQKRLLVVALTPLQAPSVKVDVAELVTTKLLTKDGGLDEILKKMERAGSLEDALLALGSTESFINPLVSKPSAITRLDDPHVFLGPMNKAAVKEGEKAFLSGNSHKSNEGKQEIGSTGRAKIVIRRAKGKPKLENITLSMWVAANA